MTDPGGPMVDDQAGAGPTGSRHRRAPRRRPRLLLGAGAVVVLAAVLGISLFLRAAAAPACAAAAAVPVLAAPPTGSAVHKGQATYYDSAGAGGNCSFVSAPANRLYVALGPIEYAAGAACGGYLDVTGPDGKVRVVIMDQCPECAPGHLDLSKEAFAKIADPVRGLVPVSYRAVVDPPLPGPLTFRMKDGASQWWFAVQVGNHGNPLRSVEAKAPGASYRKAVRQDYNYWIIDGGLGPGPYTIRVTDVYGHQAVVERIRMAPEQTQRGTVRMYGGAAGTPTRTPTPTHSATARPSPTASASAVAGPAVAASPTAPEPVASESGTVARSAVAVRADCVG